MDKKKRSWKRRYIYYGFFYGGLCILSFAGCFERLAFVPSTDPPYQTPSGLGPNAWEEVHFQSRDDKKLHGWFISGIHNTNSPPKAVVIHAHGNAGNIGNHFIPAICHCLDYGCDVLMFDYRSFGQSERGALNRYSVVEDLAGAIDFARAKTPSSKLLLLGQSMGGATSALAVREAPLRDNLDGLCLISAFADWNTVVCDVLKSNPISWIFAYPLAYTLIWPFRAEPKEGLAAWPAAKPLLLIHGKQDRIVPFHHLGMFLDALPPEVRTNAITCELETGNHNSLATSPAEGQNEVFSALETWIDRAAGSP